MKSKSSVAVQLILKILALSLVISLLIKGLGPIAKIPDDTLIVLAIVFSPSILVGLKLWREGVPLNS